MKLAVVLGTLFVSGCAILPRVTVDSPFARQMTGVALDIGGTYTIVKNDTCLPCRIVAFEKELGVLYPGREFVARTNWFGREPEIPVLAWCEYEDRFAVLATVERVPYGRREPLLIVIRDHNFVFGRGAVLEPPCECASPPGPHSTTVRLSPKRRGTLLVHVVNLKSPRAKLVVNGTVVTTIRYGAYFPYEVRYGGNGWGLPIDMEIFFVDDAGRHLGTFAETLTVPSRDVRAKQLVFTPDDREYRGRIF